LAARVDRYDHAVTSLPASRALRVTAIALALALTAACGSTASPYRQDALRRQVEGRGSGSGADIDSGSADSGSGLIDDSGSLTGGASESSGGTTRSTTRGGSTGSSGARPSASRPNGPGVSDSTITIGMVHVLNNAAAQAALGNSSASSGDPKGEALAVMKDINDHGGIRGRKLAIVFHDVDATSNEPVDQTMQATCEDFTVDHKVLVTIGFNADSYLACTRAAGTVATSGSLANASDSVFTKNPWYYDVQMLSTSKLVPNFVAELVRAKYFNAWDSANGKPGVAPVKVGVLYPDQPHWDAVVDSLLVPALAAAGHPVAKEDVVRWHFPESNADNGSSIAQIQSAILRFRSDNVTHVLPMDVNSIGFFAQPAEAQHYRPRYALNTATQVQSFVGSLVPAVQLHGALGLGWSPALDLPASANSTTGPNAGPGLKKCLDVMSKAGFTFSDQNARGVALLVCDELYSIRDSINAIPSGAPIDAISFMQGLESLGTKFSIAGLPAGSFGPGKHWPVQRGYHWVFNDACPCMSYTGSSFDLS
jgi:hypothetical protein